MYRLLEGADFQAVREIISHSVFYRRSDYYDPIQIILYEEVGGFPEGDFSAEETAIKIHSRVQLYLDEM